MASGYSARMRHAIIRAARPPLERPRVLLPKPTAQLLVDKLQSARRLQSTIEAHQARGRAMPKRLRRKFAKAVGLLDSAQQQLQGGVGFLPALLALVGEGLYLLTAVAFGVGVVGVLNLTGTIKDAQQAAATTAQREVLEPAAKWAGYAARAMIVVGTLALGGPMLAKGLRSIRREATR